MGDVGRAKSCFVIAREVFGAVDDLEFSLLERIQYASVCLLVGDLQAAEQLARSALSSAT